jgi:hypothetical protein
MLRLPQVAVAAPADSTADAGAARAPVGEAAVRDALERKVTVSFANQSFADVLTWLKQSQRLNVAVDGEHVDGEAELSELIVDFTAQDQPLGAALKRLLSDLDLAFEVRDDVLLITTRDHESAAELRAYDVRELAAVRGAFDDVEYDCRPLIAALTSTVARGHWTEYGADNAGALRGTLLVSQSAEAHERIEQCLVALRQARERQAKKPGGEPIRVERAGTAKVQASIRRKLEKPTTLRFSETPLADALGSLRDVQDLPIELDTTAMHEVGEANDFKISLDIHDIPLRSALKRMLSRMDLAFVIREQTLLVTTSERAAETMRTVVYPVRDLVEDAMAADGGDDIEAFESILRSILAVVAPRNWGPQGGGGELCPVPGAGAFVCLQSDQAHVELEQLLAALRAARGKQSDEAVAKSANDLHTKVYTLHATAMSSDRAAAELVRLITERIEPKSWPRSGAFASVVGDQLIVRQTPAVQQQVTRLLRKMALLAPREPPLSPVSVDVADPVEAAPETAPVAPPAAKTN